MQPPNSPAVLSVREMMERVGVGVDVDVWV